MNFRNLIKRHTHSPVVAIIRTDNEYDYENGGGLKPGKVVEVPLAIASVVPIPKDKLVQGQGGYYSYDEAKLYTYTGLSKGTEIRYRGRTYKVTDEQDYSEHDKNLYIYYLKRVDEDEDDRFN